MSAIALRFLARVEKAGIHVAPYEIRARDDLAPFREAEAALAPPDGPARDRWTEHDAAAAVELLSRHGVYLGP